MKEEIQKVSKREDIIINNVDKRGALVNVDRKDYIKEAESQLNDKDKYHMLPQDLTLGNNKLVNQAIDCFFFKLSLMKLQTDLKCQFREHCASTALLKFTNQETKVALLYVHSTATQLSYLNTLTTIYNPL